MQASSAVAADYVPLVNTIGLIYQIRDDYENLQSADYHNNKGFCEDLTEGKFSFPVIHAIRADPSNRNILSILKQKPTQPEVKKYAVEYMDTKTGSFAYTRAVLATLQKTAHDQVTAHGGNPLLSKILDLMKVPEVAPRD